MRGKAVSILIAATFVILTAQPAHAGEGDELEASYVASTLVEHPLNQECLKLMETQECPIRIPMSLTVTTCAGEGGLGGSGVDGIGGVRFCDVGDWRGGNVKVRITDSSDADVELIVTCPEGGIEGGGLFLNWSPDTGLTDANPVHKSVEPVFTFDYYSACPDEFFITFGAGNAVAGTVSVWV